MLVGLLDYLVFNDLENNTFKKESFCPYLSHDRFNFSYLKRILAI